MSTLPASGAEQVAREQPVRERYAALAVLAGIALVISAVVQLSGPHTKVDELTLDLLTAHKRFPLDLIGAVVDAVGLFALAGTLNWLNAITRARNPEVRGFIRWLAVVGAVLSGVMAVIYAIVIAAKASDFAAGGPQTYMQANALTSGGLIVVLPLLAQFGSLLLTGGFIWISLGGLRVGLLTRFMGYLGIFAGALVLFPIGSPVPVVQGFWLIALGVMFAGRWPAGQPPAWASGTAIPWPSTGQSRERAGGSGGAGRERGAGLGRAGRAGRAGRGGGAAKPAPTVSTAPAKAPAAEEARTRASTPKRKRKRRN